MTQSKSRPQTTAPLLAVLDGRAFPETPPVWIMRQAGRYLPEYRRLRAEQENFLDFCFNTKSIIEATCQPLARFDLDAAIVFSDIFALPQALGYPLRFEDGVGPVLEVLTSGVLEKLSSVSEDRVFDALHPVFAALTQLRTDLPNHKALLGFCGAPWTLACYAFSGHPAPDQLPARMMSYTEPDFFRQFIHLMTVFSAEYLVRQLKAGADAVQIFDSWAGVLDEERFSRWCLAPTREIVSRVRQKIPGARIIGFPRGCTADFLKNYALETGVSAVGVDHTTSYKTMRDLQEICPVQGNLDPLRLLAGGTALKEGVYSLLRALSPAGRHIFNLGHGIHPETPPEHVTDMIRLIKDFDFK